MAFGGFGGGAPSPFGGVQQQPQSPFGGGGASAFGTPNAFGAPTGASNGGNAFGGGTPGASGAFGAAQTSPGAVANACKFWNRGSCKFGARCNNKHVCSKCGSTAHRAVNCSVGGGSGYRATRVMDKELLSPGTSYAMVHSISAMPENLSKSVEEIRRDGVRQRRSAGGGGRGGRVRRDAGGESVRRSVDVDRWSVRWWRWWIRGERAVGESVRRRRRGWRVRAPSSGARSGRRRRRARSGRRRPVGRSVDRRRAVDSVRARRVRVRSVGRRRRQGSALRRSSAPSGGLFGGGGAAGGFGASATPSAFGAPSTTGGFGQSSATPGGFRIERAGGESVWGFDGDAGRLWGERADGRVRRRTDTGCVRCRANT